MTTVPMRFDDQPLLWWVDHLFSAAECAEMIAFIEKSAPTLATNNPLYRDQDRVMIDHPVLAADWFQRLQPHLPANMGELRLLRLNERLRFYRYRPGQRFAPHMDHWYQPDPLQISLHSVLLYLNDNFQGGETHFTEQLDERVQPKTGRVAVFQHKLRHEGCPVIQGTKYAVRSDVIYAADTPMVLGLD